MSEMATKTEISIVFRSAQIQAQYTDCWQYRHPLTGQYHDLPRQCLVGWSEQDTEEQKDWEYLIRRLSSDDMMIYDWLDQSEDGDCIECLPDGTFRFVVEK